MPCSARISGYVQEPSPAQPVFSLCSDAIPPKLSREQGKGSVSSPTSWLPPFPLLQKYPQELRFRGENDPLCHLVELSSSPISGSASLLKPLTPAGAPARVFGKDALMQGRGAGWGGEAWGRKFPTMAHRRRLLFPLSPSFPARISLGASWPRRSLRRTFSSRSLNQRRSDEASSPS